jgi:hypothetical protein
VVVAAAGVAGVLDGEDEDVTDGPVAVAADGDSDGDADGDSDADGEDDRGPGWGPPAQLAASTTVTATVPRRSSAPGPDRGRRRIGTSIRFTAGSDGSAPGKTSPPRTNRWLQETG